MEVRTRKPVLKPLQEKKKERPPHPPLSPPTLRCRCKRRLPATQAHTWSVLHTQDRKGGVGRRAQETSPFCIQLPERLCKKPGAGLHPQEARAMAESFSVLGCGSTCPPPFQTVGRKAWKRMHSFHEFHVVQLLIIIGKHSVQGFPGTG